MQTRSGVGGLPPPKGWVLTRGGMKKAIASHRSSGMLHSSGMGRWSMGIGLRVEHQVRKRDVQLHRKL
jgi:hypothetical protein